MEEICVFHPRIVSLIPLSRKCLPSLQLVTSVLLLYGIGKSLPLPSLLSRKPYLQDTETPPYLLTKKKHSVMFKKATLRCAYF
jgi:hypothetical protein